MKGSEVLLFLSLCKGMHLLDFHEGYAQNVNQQKVVMLSKEHWFWSALLYPAVRSLPELTDNVQ